MKATVLEIYPIAPEAMQSPFIVTVNGLDVPVVKQDSLDYAHFGFEGRVTISIGLSEEIQSYQIQPKSYKLEGLLLDSKLVFELSHKSNVVITVNNKRIAILADELDIPPNLSSREVYNIVDFGVKSSPAIQTFDIQQALNDIAKEPGRTVVFPAGLYCCGTLSIPSNISIYLAPGALIKGTDTKEDYPVDTGHRERESNGEYMTFSRQIFFDKAKNSKIYGRGVIDGNGFFLRTKCHAVPNLIRIQSSEKIEITGIILRDSAAWNTHILNSEHIKIKNVKIFNNPNNRNTDGIDPDSSSHVVIDDVFADCGDDNIAIKSSNNSSLLRDVSDILIQNSVFLTRKSSLKVGTETKAKVMENIRFKNIDILHADRAIYLISADGSHFKDITFEDIRVEAIYPDAMQMLIFIETIERSGKGKIEDVKIHGFNAHEAGINPCRIKGIYSDQLVSNVKLSNVEIAGCYMKSIDPSWIKVNEFTSDIEVS